MISKLKEKQEKLSPPKFFFGFLVFVLCERKKTGKSHSDMWDNIKPFNVSVTKGKKGEENAVLSRGWWKKRHRKKFWKNHG